MRRILIVVSFIFLQVASVYADPAITSVYGRFSHGQVVTINGLDFSTKVTAHPSIWDDCEDKTVNSPNAVVSEGPWNEALPHMAGDTNYNMQYRSVNWAQNNRRVEPPHGHSTKVLTGGHYDNYPERNNWRNGYDVSVSGWLNASHSPSEYIYVTWYQRADPRWPGVDVCGGSGGNIKIMDLSDSGGLETNDYVEFSGLYGLRRGFNTDSNDNCIKWYYLRCTDGDSSSTCNGCVAYGAQFNNPKLQWVRYEGLWRLNSSNGYLEFRIDNQRALYSSGHPISIRKDPRTINSVTIGQYFACLGEPFGRGHASAWRFFDDIYVDQTFSRAVLADHENYERATIIEPQIPSAWNDSTIICTVNLGRLPNSGTAYLFVFDANNNHNPVGYPVTIEGVVNPNPPPSPPDTTPPAPPTGLTVN